MGEYLSPGVYVEEFESGGRPMTGVSTSIAGFIGLAERGPVVGVPQLVTSPADFKRKYGGYLQESVYGDYRFLAYAIDHFFMNGGSKAFVVRVCPDDAKAGANFDEKDEKPKVLAIEAKNPGSWGNDIVIKLGVAENGKTYFINKTGDDSKVATYSVKNALGFNVGDIVEIVSIGNKDTPPKENPEYRIVTKVQDTNIQFDKNPNDVKPTEQGTLPTQFISICEFTMDVSFGDTAEKYESLSLNVNSPNFVEKKTAKSDLIIATYNPPETAPEKVVPPLNTISGVSVKELYIKLEHGSDGSLKDNEGNNTIINRFLGDDKVPGKRSGIKAFIDNDVVSIMLAPGITDSIIQMELVGHCESLGSRFAILDMPKDKKNVIDVLEHRGTIDSAYAAMYHPWLEIYDPLNSKTNIMPPSGTVAGIYSRSDTERGVHKAPANEILKGVVALDCVYNKGDQDILNPKGVNLIRPFPNQGIRVWGARTCSSNTLWRYINVKRVFIFIEESIKANTNWVVFEPNDEVLWLRVRRTIDVFLNDVWRSGALFGSSPSEAYYIDIGYSTMTQSDIDNGRLICVIGLSVVKPAEFVIFRLTQKTREE